MRHDVNPARHCDVDTATVKVEPSNDRPTVFCRAEKHAPPRDRNLKEFTEHDIPSHERFWLGNSMKFAASFASPLQAIRSLESVGRNLIDIAEHAGAEDAFHPTPVPRMIGVAPIATTWSVMMVIDHLATFNSDVLKIIRSLQRELAPRGIIQMSDYAPSDGVTWEAIENLRQSENELSWLISGDAPPSSSAVFLHPWYSGLTAHQWLCCAALHQYAHLRHVRKIVAVLGVT